MDPLPLLKKLYPDRKSYKQETLVKDLLGTEYQAYDALADIMALQSLIDVCRASKLEIGLSSFSCKYMRKTESSDKTKEHMSSLVVVPKNVLSEGLKKKIASSGLNLDHLKLAYRHGGIEGLRGMLSEKFKGKLRVTSNKRILKSVSDYVESVANKYLVSAMVPVCSTLPRFFLFFFCFVF